MFHFLTPHQPRPNAREKTGVYEEECGLSPGESMRRTIRRKCHSVNFLTYGPTRVFSCRMNDPGKITSWDSRPGFAKHYTHLIHILRR